MSLLLIIDTSLETAYVGLSLKGSLLDCRYSFDQKDHSVFIHKAIKEMLSENGLDVTELCGVVNVIGPGSYTGLRVGLSTSKGLCYALNIPLVGIGTLDLLAHTVSENDLHSLICPMIDARRMEVFTAVFDGNKQTIKAPYPLILNESSFSGLLEKNTIIFTGNGSDKFSKITKHPNAQFHKSENLPMVLSALGEKKFNQKQFENLTLSVPLYVKEHETFSDKINS